MFIKKNECDKGDTDMGVNCGSDIKCDKTSHLILKINSLFKAPVSFYYESNLTSPQNDYTIGFRDVRIFGCRSDHTFEIENPMPTKEGPCIIKLRPSSKHITFSGKILGSCSNAGRSPLMYTRLNLKMKVFQKIEHLIVEIHFPKELRGYIAESKICVQRNGSTEKLGLSKEPWSHHIYKEVNISHFFSINNILPSEIEISACFRLKPSLVVNFLVPFFYGSLVFLTWLYLPLPFNLKISMTIGLISLYVTLWFKSQYYTFGWDNLVNVSFGILPILWFLIILQSLLLNNKFDVYVVLLYGLSVSYATFSTTRFLYSPRFRKYFRKSINLIYFIIYWMRCLITREAIPSISEIDQVWEEQ